MKSLWTYARLRKSSLDLYVSYNMQMNDRLKNVCVCIDRQTGRQREISIILAGRVHLENGF